MTPSGPGKRAIIGSSGSPPLGGPNLSDWSLPFDQDRQDRRKVSNSDPDRTDTSAKVPRALSEIKKHPRLFRTSRHSALGEQNSLTKRQSLCRTAFQLMLAITTVSTRNL